MSPASTHLTPVAATTVIPDPFAACLEQLATLHDSTEWAFRSLAEQFARRDAETAELRDEVLALSNRIESVFRALESQRSAGATLVDLRPLAGLSDSMLVAAWNSSDDDDASVRQLARELTMRGYGTHAGDGTPLHLVVRHVAEYACSTCGHRSAGWGESAKHERETDHQSEPTGRRVPVPANTGSGSVS